jgi:hypothetical protein
MWWGGLPPPHTPQITHHPFFFFFGVWGAAPPPPPHLPQYVSPKPLRFWCIEKAEIDNFPTKQLAIE